VESSGVVRLRYLNEGEVVAREYRRDDLRRGDRIEGPAVIREATSTTFVPAAHLASVGTYGEIVIERA
jgi:N-methylhydantoinase A